MPHTRIEPYFICPLCSQPIELETANTDEKGQAVHEDCYVALILAQCPIPASTSRSLLILSALATEREPAAAQLAMHN
jgi:hypothetical protein